MSETKTMPSPHKATNVTQDDIYNELKSHGAWLIQLDNGAASIERATQRTATILTMFFVVVVVGFVLSLVFALF